MSLFGPNRVLHTKVLYRSCFVRNIRTGAASFFFSRPADRALQLIDAVEALGIDPADAAPDYSRKDAARAHRGFRR